MEMEGPSCESLMASTTRVYTECVCVPLLHFIIPFFFFSGCAIAETATKKKRAQTKNRNYC